MDRNYFMLGAFSMFVGIKTVDELGRGVAFALIALVMLTYLILTCAEFVSARKKMNG